MTPSSPGAGLARLLPRPADERGVRTSWTRDLVAGVTVGVVALPLALAIAIAAGLGPAVGLTTAIVAGLVAAAFGGSDLQVSGPTGAMAVVLLPVVARFGAGAVPTVGLIAGMLVLVAGLARIGRAVSYVPWPVVEGFALGIAVIIFLEQVPAVLGVAKPSGSTAEAAWRSVLGWAGHPTVESLALVGIVAAVMIGLPLVHRSLPSSLVARIPLAALAAVLMVTAVRMVDPSNVWSVLRATRSDALVLALTAVATVAVNLIVAIELGLAVAGGLALLHLARSATFTSERLSDDRSGDGSVERQLADEHVPVYRIDGPLFFAMAQRFLEEFAEVSDARVVILRLADVQGLDASAALTLGHIVDHLERRGITVLLKGVRPEHLRILEAVGSLDHLAHEHHVFADLPSAVDHARLHVARSGPSGAD